MPYLTNSPGRTRPLSAACPHPPDAGEMRRAMRLSLFDGVFAVQYVTLAGRSWPLFCLPSAPRPSRSVSWPPSPSWRASRSRSGPNSSGGAAVAQAYLSERRSG